MNQKAPNRIIDPWRLDLIRPNPRAVAARGDRFLVASWVFDLFNRWYPEGWSDNGACLHWAHAGCCVLRVCGYRAIFQAGSASWPIQIDQGDNPTHFSYMWDPSDSLSAERIAQGALPEVHCWCALPERGEIVDFSTGSLKRICEGRHGLKWELEDPPPFLWATAEQMPERWIYRAHYAAIKHVCEWVNEKIHGREGVPA